MRRVSRSCPAFALAEDRPRAEALYDIALDIDDDGKTDRAVLVLVGPGRTDFGPLDIGTLRVERAARASTSIFIWTRAKRRSISPASRMFVRKAIVDTEETSWVQPLERNGGGSLLVTSVYGWGAVKTWGETLTIVYRDGEFLVAGYSQGLGLGQRSPQTGRGLGRGNHHRRVRYQLPLGKRRRRRTNWTTASRSTGKFTPVKLADWSTANRPEACEF